MSHLARVLAIALWVAVTVATSPLAAQSNPLKTIKKLSTPKASYTTDELIQTIRNLENAKLHEIDAPRKNAIGKFGISVGNHTNGLARIGPLWWVTNYPNYDRETGRLLFWNQTLDDYEDPKEFDTDGGYPAGMDSAGPYLAVAYAKERIKFFKLDERSGAMSELASFTPPSGGRRESVGLAFHPERNTYYLVSGTEVFVGTPGGAFQPIGTVPRTPGYNESQPLVYLGQDRFAVFALGPKEGGNPYEFSFFMFSVDSNNAISNISPEECFVTLSHPGEGGGAPSFRWAGSVIYEQGILVMSAAPKRLDASGNYYLWFSVAKLAGK